MFHLYLSDTLRAGESSLTFHSTRLHREPGALSITSYPVSFTLGLHDRVEFFFSWEAYQRIKAPGLNNFDGPGRPRSSPPRPFSFYNDTPFLVRSSGDGSADLWTGLKVNLFSERRGAPFGLAIQPILRVHAGSDFSRLTRGLSAGVTDAGFDLVFSKNMGKGTLAANAGFLFAGDNPPNPGNEPVDRQNRFNYGLGVDIPLGRNDKAHLVGEVVGSAFSGSRTALANPASPLDLYWGVRVFATPWAAITAAYGFNFHTLDQGLYGSPVTGRHGWFAQLSVQRKRNQPPSIECHAQPAAVTEGESTTIQARVLDPDDDFLAITWTSSGGRMDPLNGSVIFDSSGLQPGRYTIKGEVTDGKSRASCSVDVKVVRE